MILSDHKQELMYGVLGRRKRYIAEASIVVLAALIIATWLTWPLAAQMRDHAIEPQDSLLNAYLQAWVTHAIVTRAPLFDTNMFYPATDTLALSENMLGNQIVFGPVYLVSKNPVLACNIVTFSSFVLCALSMYLLARYLTANPWASAIAAVIFAFSPVRLSQLAHMQLLSMYWMPLIVLFLLRYLESGRALDLSLLTTSIGMQILCSLYLGYMALMVAGAFFAAILIATPKLLNGRKLAGLLLAATVLGALLFPVIHPYRRLENTSLNAKENENTTISASASPIASYAEGSGRIYHNLFRRFHSHDLDWEKHLFVGLIPIGLATIAMAGQFRRKNKTNAKNDHSAFCLNRSGTPHRPVFLGAVIVVVGSYVLSLGPLLRVHDRTTDVHLPFYLLQKAVPGMGTFRVPARFALTLMFGLGLLACSGFLILLEKLGRRTDSRRWFGAALGLGLVVLIGFEFNIALWPFSPVIPPHSLAPEYLWIKQQPSDAPILELPLGPGGDYDFRTESAYVFTSTFYWRPLVNGYSGHMPPTFPEMLELARAMPERDAAELLAGLGVRIVILHTQDLPEESYRSWKTAEIEGRLRAIALFPHTVIYELPATICEGLNSDPSLQAVQLPKEIARSKRLTASLALSAGSSCWADSTSHGRTLFSTRWSELGSRSTFNYSSYTAWPLYLHSSFPQLLQATLRAPDKPGIFLLSMNVGPYHIGPRQVTIHDGPPSLNSINAPEKLRAHYDLLLVPNRITAGQKVPIEFLAGNTGRSVWLSDTGKGAVGLGYRWLTPQGDEISEGRVYIPYDVYPGDEYTFRGTISAPSRAGSYVARFELVSELVTWFHDEGVPPIDVPVQVESQ